MNKKRAFPSPHEVPAVPGTEGWERMYPYFYTFTTEDKEMQEYENKMLWYYDGLHYPKFNEALSKLENSEKGREWIKFFKDNQYPWFHMSTGTGWYHDHWTWYDRIEIPFGAIKNYIDISLSCKQGRKLSGAKNQPNR